MAPLYMLMLEPGKAFSNIMVSLRETDKYTRFGAQRHAKDKRVLRMQEICNPTTIILIPPVWPCLPWFVIVRPPSFGAASPDKTELYRGTYGPNNYLDI